VPLKESNKENQSSNVKLPFLTILNTLFLFLIIICQMNVTISLSIKDDFTFCDPNSRTLIDISSSCTKSNSKHNSIEINNFGKNKIHIFDQAKHLISGIAHECSIIKTSLTTYKNLFGYETIDNFDEISLIITLHACEQLIKTKMCYDKEMTCLDGICQTDNKIIKDYAWLEHKKFEIINCKVVERYLVADKVDDTLFNSLKCKIFDGSCNMPNSLIIWDVQKILHRCPLYYLTSTNITLENNFIISDEDNFIFNVVSKGNFTSCGNINFYKTSQNLFLTFDDSALNLPKIDNEFFDLNKIRTAESDMSNYKSFESQRQLAFEICLTLENIIKVATLNEKRFLKLTDSKENELIIYLTQGQAFVTKCLILKNLTIEFLELKYDNNFCNTQMAIEYFIGSIKFRGYLHYDNIISPLERKCLVDCVNLNQTYYFKNSKMVLKRIGNKLSLEPSTELLQAKPLDFGLSDISELNFKHSKLNENGFDFMKEFHSDSFI
jgi:hypothetical protein